MKKLVMLFWIMLTIGLTIGLGLFTEAQAGWLKSFRFPKEGGILNIGQSHHEVYFNLGKKNLIRGLDNSSAIYFEEIDLVRFAGENGESETAELTIISPGIAVAVLEWTEIQDSGNWEVVLKGTEEVVKFIPAKWDIRGDNVTIDTIVSYGTDGNPPPPPPPPITVPSIEFSAVSMKLIIVFDKDRQSFALNGSIVKVDPLKVVRVFFGSGEHWNWDNDTSVVPTIDGNGILTAKMPVKLNTDKGNIGVHLQDGTDAWVNVGSLTWVLRNVSFDAKLGLITYPAK